MSRNGNSYFLICRFLDLLCQLICDRRIFSLGDLLFIFFLFQFCILFRDCTFRNRKNRKRFSFSRPSVDHICDHIDIIRDFRKKDNIRAARYTCMKRYISYFVSHYLYNKYTAVGRCRRMDSVNRICRNIHRALKSECHFCSPQIVIDRLRKRDHIQSLFPKKICRFMRSVSS